MRVLFVTGEFPPMQGGVGDYTRELGLALGKLDCQVHVATSRLGRPVAGLSVYPFVERWNWGCWKTILDLVGCQRPDVVHVQYQAAAYAMHPAINLLPRRLRALGADRPRIATTFHDTKVPYLFPKAGRLRRWIVNELARQSDTAITTNREDYMSLGSHLRRSPALIPIGSNIARQLPVGFDRDAWRAKWKAGPEDLLLCFFGFVNERKGVETLLHTLKLLSSEPKAGGDTLLLMIGGQTGSSDPTNVAYLAHIRNLIVEVGLQGRVLWTGFIPNEEVSASFAAADLCVLPFRDGASLLHGTLHAALAHGVPILTTRPRVVVPELVHGQNVFLVPPNQPKALAEAIRYLAARPELRRGLGGGAQALSEQFGWDRIAATTLELYHRLDATL